MVTRIPPLKHVINGYANNVNLSTTTIFDLAVGVLNPDSYTTAVNVRNGSIIRNLNVAIDWLTGDVPGTEHDSFDWYIWFNVNGAQTVANPQTVNASHLKNQIFHQDGTISCVQEATAVGFSNANVSKWRLNIAVPRWAQQLNDGDKIQLVMITTKNATISDYRFQVIYKEVFP